MKLREDLRALVARAADRDKYRDGTTMEFGVSVAIAAYRLGFARGQQRAAKPSKPRGQPRRSRKENR